MIHGYGRISRFGFNFDRWHIIMLMSAIAPHNDEIRRIRIERK